MSRGGDRRDHGAALVVALFVLLLVGVSLALLALSLRVRLEEQQREIRRARLELQLDGVMAETLGRLAIDPRFGGVGRRPAGAGEAWSEVERVGAAAARVRATAVLGPRRADVEAVVRLVPGPPRILSWRRGPRADPAATGPASGRGLQ